MYIYTHIYIYCMDLCDTCYRLNMKSLSKRSKIISVEQSSILVAFTSKVEGTTGASIARP